MIPNQYPLILIDDLTASNFIIEKGKAKAILPEEKKLDDYYWSDGSRDYDSALEQRIKRQLEAGRLIVKNHDGSIKFDDQKLRYDTHSSTETGYIIKVAPTYFGEVKRTNLRTIKDREFYEYLKRKGVEDFEDPFAYFARSMSVSAIPVSPEGYVHVFKRAANAELLPEHWHVVGGMLDTDLTLFDYDKPTEKFTTILEEAIRKEFLEEANLTGGKFILNGLVDGLSTVDFTHLVRLNVSSKEFLTTMDGAAEKSDHTDYLILRSPTEVLDFLNSKEKIVPICRGSLGLYLKFLRR